MNKGLLWSQIASHIESSIAPALATHQGSCELKDIELTKDEDLVVYIQYQGACNGCAYSETTTLSMIQNLLREELNDPRIVVEKWNE